MKRAAWVTTLFVVACGTPEPVEGRAPSEAFTEFVRTLDAARETVPVRVTALASDGSVLPDVALVAVDQHGGTTWRAAGRTGTDGTAIVEVRRGGVVALHPSTHSAQDASEGAPTRFDVPLDGDVPAVTLRAPAALCSVPLRFRAEDGPPPRGAIDVALARGDAPPFARLDAAQGGTVRLPCWRRAAVVASGPAGRSLRIIRDDDGSVYLRAASIEVEADERSAPVEITLATSTRLDVRVHDDEGAPLAGAAITFGGFTSVTDADGRATQWTTRSDVTGDRAQFTVEAPGRVTLSTYERTHGPAWLQLALDPWLLVTDAGDHVEVDVTMTPVRWVEVGCLGSGVGACVVPEARCERREEAGWLGGPCVAVTPTSSACPCPERDAVVAGLGFPDVPVSATTRALDLDLRGDVGAVIGRVPGATCSATAFRIERRGDFTLQLSDGARTSAECEGGAFRIAGLGQGEWAIKVVGEAGSATTEFTVGRDTVDLGMLALTPRAPKGTR